jgi:acyl-coenzyme A thioesterase 7
MACQVEITRLMQPDDANIAGNVHGGTILQMIEQAGWISATRHCNSNGNPASERLIGALVRLEHIDFMKPMHIGSVATLDAVVAYTSARSLMVKVTVYAEDVFKCTKHVTNRAVLWYVALALTPGTEIAMPVPEISGLSDSEKEEGQKLYLAQKADREAHRLVEPEEVFGVSEVDREMAEPHTVSASISTLSRVIGPSECVQPNNNALGGSLMKVMDTVAGIVAYRHCHTNVVTASIDAIDFHQPVYKGNVITVMGRLIFTSQRSMLIEVLAMKENLLTGKKDHTASAFFTFVSLDVASGRALPVPPLVVITDEEQTRYQKGKLRYEEAKRARAC